MVGPKLTKDDKTLPRYDQEFGMSDRHPCTYQFISSSNASQQGNPLFEIVVHAEKNEISYGQAVKDCRTATQGTGRQGDIPVIDGASATLVDRLMDLDELARGGGGGTRVPKNKINNVWLSAKNTYQNEEYRYVCAQLAPLFVGHKPPVTMNDIESLSDDNKKLVADAVGIPSTKLGVEQEDDDEEDQEERDFIDDKKDNQSAEERNTIQTRDVWGTDDDFSVWMYSKMIGREDIADSITADNDVTRLDNNDDLNRIIQASSSPSDLTQRFNRDDVLEMTPEQQNKWSKAQEIISNYSDDNEALKALVNEMSRLQMAQQSEDDESDSAQLIDPGIEDDESWIRSDPDPTDGPEQYDSILLSE